MTTITATEIILRESISCKAKQVFTYLAHRSNRENTCFPGLKRIAKECGMSLSSVQRALNELVAEGFLKKLARHRIDGSQTTNLYVLIEGLEKKALAKEEALKAKKEKMKNECREKQLKIQDCLTNNVPDDSVSGNERIDNSEQGVITSYDLSRMDDVQRSSLHINKSKNIFRRKQKDLKMAISNFINKSENSMIEFQLKTIKLNLKHISSFKKIFKFQHLNRGGVHSEQPDNFKRLTVFTFRK